ncbi:chemotaxis protein CheB [Pontibacter diazotrophicus]|uniref:protein-glutamate methylesterase n=1 Tax=Pontibacter diazotrophicus TaxID=1400979 RepID=A0A3D8LAZ0_9BACT|nr:chemotaxis protein CheB [Pontibacter diazotrophicus]RDV14589.1 chemotaxis protein CheB [Pontibacter diazotrophicus]
MPKHNTAEKQNSQRDIIVIGSSAGGVKALLEFVKHLPSAFPASIFIVQHVAPHTESILPEIITMLSPLEAKHPKDGEKIKPGTIYIAPPDHHMLLEEGKITITKGPKENRFRPSIDALFRSAAYVYGPRVIGAVLSGYLDDGTSGLWSVQRLGGKAIVQDPHDAAFPDMPSNALEFVKADHIVPIAELAALLVSLTTEVAPGPPKVSEEDMERLKIEITIARQDNAFEMGIIKMGELTPFTCPDCHGALTKLIEGNLIRFRCHTGHAYTISTLLAEVTESVESILYQAMRGLEETKMLLHNMGDHFQETGQEEVAKLFFQKAKDAGKQARVVHDSIFQHELLSGDMQFRKKDIK